ncbi:MAG: glycosyltransferase 87 family protein [Actinomycetes bacterium]
MGERRGVDRISNAVRRVIDDSFFLVPIGIALVITVGFVLAAQGQPVGLDLAARGAVVDAGSSKAAVVASWVTQLGSGAVLYPLLIVLAVWKRTWQLAVLPLVLAVGQVTEVALLSVVPRTSPSTTIWVGLSSGHVSTAVLGWGLVALALGVATRRSVGAGVAVGSVVAVTRVVLDLHWTSDAIIGLLFGTLLLGMWCHLRRHIPQTPLTLGSPWRWLRTSPWAWMFAAIASAATIAPTLKSDSDPLMGDLAVYIGSAKYVDAGWNLYSFRTEPGLPFTYPPFAALIAEPLARMPLAVVQVAWIVATLVAVVAVAHVAMRPVVDRIGLPITVALLVSSTPVRSHFRFGQVGLFLVLLVAADLLSRRRIHGWGVGIAAAIKMTPVIYVLWLGVCGRWTRFRAALVWGASATVLGIVLLYPSSPAWVSSALWDSSRFGLNDIPGNQAVRGMLLRAFESDAVAERIWIVCALALLAVGVWGARRLELSGHRLGAVGTLAATSVAVSPISWHHHLVWLTLPIAALFAAGYVKTTVSWAALLILPTTTWGTKIDVPVLGAIATDTLGLTAVAATVALPYLLLRADRRPGAGLAELSTSDAESSRSTSASAGGH